MPLVIPFANRSSPNVTKELVEQVSQLNIITNRTLYVNINPTLAMVRDGTVYNAEVLASHCHLLNITYMFFSPSSSPLEYIKFLLGSTVAPTVDVLCN